MDRRSFELNYENNILFYDPALTAEMRRRQDAYLAQSRPVTADEWPPGWPAVLEQRHRDARPGAVNDSRVLAEPPPVLTAARGCKPES